jgi:CRP/FNR family transcriptional regulator, cyclic AMP receptor protein
MSRQQQVAQLQRVALFERCSKRDLSRLAAKVRFEQVDAGHVLLTAGSPSRNLYLIVAGTAAVERDGRRVATLGPGDVVGELGVILDRPRNATVSAETPIEWLVLDRAALRSAIDEIPGLGWKLLESVASRLDERLHDVVDPSTDPSADRPRWGRRATWSPTGSL